MAAPSTITDQRDLFDGVLTRVAFSEHIDASLVPFADDVYAMCFLHLDNLKHYNRVYGITEGDLVLREIIDWVQETAVRGFVARYAGDGFIFVVRREQIEGLADSINVRLPTYGETDGLEAKLGICSCRRPMGAEDCVERARFACDSILDEPGTHQYLFDERLQVIFDKRAYVVDHLDDAIAAGEIQAWAQPIVRLLTGRICEVEVLARWKSDRFGFLYPDEFVPELERQRLIHKLDIEVIRLACKQWDEARRAGTEVPFGINLSRLDFELCDIFAIVCAIADEYDVPHEQMHVEITESASGRHKELVGDGVRRFQEAGFTVYMDDFGTGYSSLTSLISLPFNVVKFDKELLDRVQQDERARVVLSDLITTAKRLGIKTLCEGVEDEDQLLFLKAVGCEKAQGYYFSRPMPHDDVMTSLDARAHDRDLITDYDYLDTIGQINLLDGTSADLHGVEAASFLGQYPIAVLEFRPDGIKLLERNIAYLRLLEKMGFHDLESFVEHTMAGDGRVNARAVHAAELAKETGEPQYFDFIVNDVFCSASIRFIAESEGREAYLNIVTSSENSPLISDRVLLRGMIDGMHRKVFWKDTDRRFLGANDEFLDFFGFEGLGDVLGKTDEDLGWNVTEELSRLDEVLVLTGKTITDMKRICICGGVPHDIVVNKHPLYSVNGAIVGLVGYFKDLGPHVEA